MEYRNLKADHKRRVLEEDIARFEVEHYRHHLALMTAQEMGDERAAAQASANLESLETAIRVRAEEIDKLS